MMVNGDDDGSINKNWLVVEPTPLKKMKIKWDDEIPKSDGKIKLMFQSPPARKKQIKTC